METETAVYLFLPATLAMIMLAMGLGLTIDNFLHLAKNPRAAVVGLVCQMVLLPLCGFAVAYGFDLGPELAVGLIILTACPGGAHSNLFTSLARGDTALSVTLTAVSGVLTVFTIPIIATLAIACFSNGTSELSMPVVETMGKIFGLMAVPIGVGMLLRSHFGTKASRLEKVVKGVAVLMIVLIIVGAVGRQAERVLGFAITVGAPVVFLSLGTMLLGFAATRIFNLPMGQAIAIVMEVGIQNGALAVGLTMSFFGESFAVPAIIYSLFAYIPGVLLIVVGRALRAR